MTPPANPHISVLTFAEVEAASTFQHDPPLGHNDRSGIRNVPWSEPMRVLPWDIPNYTQEKSKFSPERHNGEAGSSWWPFPTRHEKEKSHALSTQPFL